MAGEQNTAGTTENIDKPAPNISLQQQMEQLEAGVTEAHDALDRISSGGTDKDAPATETGAQATGFRVQDDLQSLISRIIAVADRVGAL